MHGKIEALVRTLDDPIVVVMGGLALAPKVEVPCPYCQDAEYWIWRATIR